MSTTNNEVHIKLKISGNEEKITLFHWILGDLDRDWPWNPKANGHLKICPDCEGGIYINPYFAAEDVKALAKQLNDTGLVNGNLKVKIKRYCKGSICKETKEEPEKEEKPLVQIVSESLADRIYGKLGIN